ncbi:MULTISPECIES: KR domain-containing protein [Streptomyces]|uniref:Ketoreductase domain-containing protein n=1 Tax=Streptomyces luteosporeus TaxID=173856 RepID=A0ABP6G9S5_9ACTN
MDGPAAVRGVQAFRTAPEAVADEGAAPAAAPFRWSVLHGTAAPDRLVAALQHASRPDGEKAVAVVLGAGHRPRDNALLLEGVARAAATPGRRLVLVHRGAGGASLLRAAALEAPGLRVTALEQAGPLTAERVARLVRAAGDGAEVHVAQDGTATRTVWRPAALPAAAPGPAGGTVLITGGLGGLGLRAAGVLAARAGWRPVLLDVTAPGQLDAASARLLARLRAAVPRTRVLTADVTDPKAVAAALWRLGAPVHAVVHCAGLVDGGPVAGMHPADLARLQAAKTGGLHAVLDALDVTALRQVVVFGSITARVPHRQMGGYALANELLRRQALRRAAVLPHCATVVAEWSVWSGAGQAHAMGAVPQARRMGMAPVPLGPGMAALLRLVAWPPGPGRGVSLVLTGEGDRTFPPLPSSGG